MYVCYISRKLLSIIHFPCFFFFLHLPFNMNHKRWRKSIILRQAPTIFNFVINRANERRSLCLLPFIFLTWAVPGQRGNRRPRKTELTLSKRTVTNFHDNPRHFSGKSKVHLTTQVHLYVSFFNYLIFCSLNTRISLLI